MLVLRRQMQAIGAAALIALSPWFLAKALAAEQVPFVGCASDGQLGPVAAPTGAAKTIAADAATAGQLAYYQAKDSFGVLAPRGWNCFYVYGSNGASLMVAPGVDLASTSVSRLSGPAVVETIDIGGTSGRFDVAKYSARLFPKLEQAFIKSVIAEGIEPKKDFPSGPYPADKIIHKNARLITFVTPGNKDGLGTSDRLQKSALPIQGMAKLEDSSDGPNFVLLTVRLPANQTKLASAIVAAGE